MKKKIYYITLALLISFLILNNSASNIDEIWSYTFAKNIADGLIPYKDFNMIVTPLSCFINSILLNISNNLFMFRIITILYYFYLIYILTQIFNKLKIKDYIKYISISLIPILLIRYCYLDYNILSLILILTAINIELSKNKYKNIIIPILIGLVILTKQTIGAVLSILYVISLIIGKKIYKEKITNKEIINRIILICMPFILFIIYLIINNNIKEFIDMCILGIFTFTNKAIIYKALALLLLITITFVISIILNKKDKLNIIFIVYSLSSLLIAYPIIDVVHSLIAVIPMCIYIIYVFNKIKFNIKFDILYVIIPITMVYFIYNVYTYINSYKSDIRVYRYIPIEKEVDNNIKIVKEYINNDNTFIIDYSAGIYMLSVNRYNKYFDLFMNGNFGVIGYNEMINKLDNTNNILLINDKVKNYQEPSNVKNYIKNYYYSDGTIGKFTIYKHKNSNLQ